MPYDRRRWPRNREDDQYRRVKRLIANTVFLGQGLHGYSHENPTAMTLEQQTAIMDKCYHLIKDFQGGKPPRGMVAPWWESSQEGAELMLRYGLEYDHSFSHHDCQCYWLRTGDKWIPIDYKKQPEHWMKPLEGGAMTGLCEIPASWYL